MKKRLISVLVMILLMINMVPQVVLSEEDSDSPQYISVNFEPTGEGTPSDDPDPFGGSHSTGGGTPSSDPDPFGDSGDGGKTSHAEDPSPSGGSDQGGESIPSDDPGPSGGSDQGGEGIPSDDPDPFSDPDQGGEGGPDNNPDPSGDSGQGGEGIPSDDPDPFQVDPTEAPSYDPLSVSISGPSTVIPGESITVHSTVAGGSGNYSYTWSWTHPNSYAMVDYRESCIIYSAIQGTYTFYLTVTDDTTGESRMSSTLSVEVKAEPVEYDPLECQVTVSAQSVAVGDTVTAQATVSGGVGPFNYKWTLYLNDQIISSATDTQNKVFSWTADQEGAYKVEFGVYDSGREALTGERVWTKCSEDVIAVETVKVGGFFTQDDYSMFTGKKLQLVAVVNAHNANLAKVGLYLGGFGILDEKEISGTDWVGSLTLDGTVAPLNKAGQYSMALCVEIEGDEAVWQQVDVSTLEVVQGECEEHVWETDPVQPPEWEREAAASFHPHHDLRQICSVCGAIQMLPDQFNENCCLCTGEHEYVKVPDSAVMVYWCRLCHLYKTDSLSSKERAKLYNEALKTLKDGESPLSNETIAQAILSQLAESIGDNAQAGAFLTNMGTAKDTYQNLFSYSFYTYDLDLRSNTNRSNFSGNTVHVSSWLWEQPMANDGVRMTLAHETGHAIDANAAKRQSGGSAYGYDTFSDKTVEKMIYEDVENYLNERLLYVADPGKLSEAEGKRIVQSLLNPVDSSYQKLTTKETECRKLLVEFCKEELRMLTMSSQYMVQDVIGGVTNNEIYVGFGHENDYWFKKGKSTHMQSLEAWAEFFAASVMGDEKAMSVNKSFFPKTCQYFEETVAPRMLKAFKKGCAT